MGTLWSNGGQAAGKRGPSPPSPIAAGSGHLRRRRCGSCRTDVRGQEPVDGGRTSRRARLPADLRSRRAPLARSPQCAGRSRPTQGAPVSAAAARCSWTCSSRRSRPPGPSRRGATSGTTATASASSSPGTTPTVHQPPGQPLRTPTSTPSPAPNATCKAVPSSLRLPRRHEHRAEAGTAFTRVPAQATSGPGWTGTPAYNSIFVTGSGAVLDALDVCRCGRHRRCPTWSCSNSRITVVWRRRRLRRRGHALRPGDSSYRGSNARIIDNVILGTPAGCTHRARSRCPGRVRRGTRRRRRRQRHLRHRQRRHHRARGVVSATTGCTTSATWP